MIFANLRGSIHVDWLFVNSIKTNCMHAVIAVTVTHTIDRARSVQCTGSEELRSIRCLGTIERMHWRATPLKVRGQAAMFQQK